MLKSNQGAQTDFANNECAGCGLKRELWIANAGEGYVKEGQTYCCRGCAKGAACACASISASSPGAPKDAARIVEVLRRKPGIQVVDRGQIHAERRCHQVNWARRTERRSRVSRGGSPLS